MSAEIAALVLPLFVPADRPERFVKAAAAGPCAVIVDLEDAVAPPAKAAAREGLPAAVAGLEAGLEGVPLLLRINATGTPWHAADLDCAARLPLAGVMLAKAESAAEVAAVAAATGKPVIALVETARGLAAAGAIAEASARIAFGSIDYAADLGLGHSPMALAPARAALVLAARLAGRPSPIDGVTTAIRDEALIARDCRHALEMGMGAKLLIHPAQIAPARAGFAPSPEETDWARRVLAAAGTGAAVAVDGAMVDAPVIARARQLLARAAA